MKTGILLINLGTPDAPRSPEVRRYLKQFLSDDRVLDLDPVLRWLLLRLVILPFRSRKSAQAYAKIWVKEGSPLLVYGRRLRDALTERFQAEGIPVTLGMRYGNPSIPSAMQELRDQGCDHLVVTPLYPQYASSSSGTALQVVYETAARLWNTPSLTVVPAFYDRPEFIDAFAEIGRPYLNSAPDHVLFSFHGLPERYVQKSDDSGRWCLQQPNCCTQIRVENRNCYSAQCHHTAQRLSQALQVKQDCWSTAFQSRLGRNRWLQPDTPSTLKALARSGKHRVVVFCPAFVADCLETLEEIAIRANAEFQGTGGESLTLVPSLNGHPAWVAGLETLLRSHFIPA
ncbi:MAG: ferrochelatase [Deltaproteobacteria bacterium]|nr:ferrochelatase [Deltaproteobacteria bacterium]